MVSVTLLPLVVSTIIGAFALSHSHPEDNANALFPRQTPNSAGYHDGWYYNFWSDGGGQHNYTNLPGGRYNVSWAYPGNFIGGKGWEKGKVDRVIRYSGNYSPSGNSYVAVYGFMKNPWIQYYIIDDFGTYNPSSVGVYKGTVATDSGTYRVSQSIRVPPGLEPILHTYWSVRDRKRVGGTVTIKNHFDAFQSYGMKLGTVQDYQILAIEGYYSSGKADITLHRDP